jgi:uncharacterized sulfatase
VFGEVYEHTAIAIDSPSKNLLYRWVREKNWKLIVPVNESATTRAELYDLAADPYETKNLANQQVDRVVALRKRLDAWWSGH